MSESPAQPTMTAKAADAFAAYVALGPGRSLRKLADHLVQRNVYKTSSVAFRVLSEWSAKYGWQDRIAAARSAEADRMLQEAADLDAATFLETSRLLNERIGHTSPLQLDAVVKMRESVRKPTPKGGASVNVNVSVEVRHLAEQLASEMGMSADDLIAEAEAIASREWDKAGKA